jgi:tetratricopeptide (TPR) repeat protein
MQGRIVRAVVVVVAFGVAAAGCGKYSISNIRSAKAFQDANKLYQKSDFEAAVARYEDAVKFNPDLGFAYFFLGHSYESLYKPGREETRQHLNTAAGHYRTAITKLATATSDKEQEIRQRSFEYLIALYGPGKLDNFAQAEPIAKELIALDPTDPGPYRMLAKLYGDQGRMEEAEALLLKSIEVRPAEAASGYQLLANFYNDQGNFEKTMESWYKRAELEPNNAEAWHTIGVFYYGKVFQDKRLPRAEALEYALKGLEAEDKALALNNEYFEALTYKNILLRMRALHERDPKVQKALGEEADRLRDRAMEIQKRQNAAAAAADAKGGGS